MPSTYHAAACARPARAHTRARARTYAPTARRDALSRITAVVSADLDVHVAAGLSVRILVIISASLRGENSAKIRSRDNREVVRHLRIRTHVRI